MATIGTNRGVLTDREFEALAWQDLRHEQFGALPAGHQLEWLLERYGVPPTEAEWARSVALRALAKLVVGSTAAHNV